MRLTNMMRDAFVRRALDDVPCVDYDSQVRELVQREAVAALPPLLQRAWKDPEARSYFKLKNFQRAGESVAYPSNENTYGNNLDWLSSAAKATLEGIERANDEQKAVRRALRDKLHAVAYSVTTRKALVAALPEFEKYLPADEPAAIRSLPVVANVVADFVKAGWPKGKQA